MRKFLSLIVLILVLFSALVPMASAQTTEPAPVSDACVATVGLESSGVGPYTIGPDEYFAGEQITFTFVGGAETTFTLTINGVARPEIFDSSSEPFEYDVPTDDIYTFEVTVTNGTVDSAVTVDCLSADEAPDYLPGTICHIPPGNPDNAHTIKVGLPAVEAHLRHGDTEGPCPQTTRYDNSSSGLSIFIIFATGEIEVYGNCDDSECEVVTTILITDLIDFSELVVVGEDGELDFADLGQGDDYGYDLPDNNDEDGISVTIYYLHPDPDNDGVGVFQINVYKDGVLVDDGVLLFITTDGTITLWTSQVVWELRLEAALADED